MGRPKKKPFAVRKQAKLIKKVQADVGCTFDDMNQSLLALGRAIDTDPRCASTWRWAALDIFRTLSRFPPGIAEVQRLTEIALDTARYAQEVMKIKSVV